MYRLAAMHSITDRQMTLSCQQMILHAIRSANNNGAMTATAPFVLLTRFFFDFTQNLKQCWAHAMAVQRVFSTKKHQLQL